MPPPGAPRIAAYTWTRLWRPELLGGLVGGITGLASFVAMRSLGAPDWTPQFLAVASQSVWLVAPGLEAFTSRLDARRTILWLGFLSYVPLLLLAFLPVTPTAEGHGAGVGPWGWFVAAIVVLGALDGAFLPVRGALLRGNFPDEVRGRFFGWMSAVSKAATVASSKVGGVLLDLDPRWLRVVFPLAGVAGIAKHVSMARIRWHRSEAVRAEDHDDTAGRFVLRLREGWAVLRDDRAFLVYEIGFMLYGLGFLSSHPLLADFMNRTLRLSYDEATWALGFAEPLSYLAVALLVGPVVHRAGIVVVTCGSFLVLTTFFLALAFVETPFAFVVLHFVFGASMAGVNLGWNLGPLRFAPAGKARAYSAVHLLMVGVRIAIAPFFGYWLAHWAGVRMAFGVSAVLVAAGAVTTGLLGRRIR
jgi:MFS family permease